MEAGELFQNKTDIFICDGFVGNVFLKAFEGIARDVFAYLKNEFQKEAAVSTVLLSFLKKLYTRLDESEYGGSVLIGLNGIVSNATVLQRESSQPGIEACILLLKKTNYKIEIELKGNS